MSRLVYCSIDCERTVENNMHAEAEAKEITMDVE
jgi:hypothetical protein